jgi:hypothetical protein
LHPKKVQIVPGCILNLPEAGSGGCTRKSWAARAEVQVAKLIHSHMGTDGKKHLLCHVACFCASAGISKKG